MEEDKKEVNYYQLVEQTYQEKFDMYDKHPKEKLIEMLIEANKYLVGEIHKPTMVYHEGENAGVIAKKYKVPVGEIGCPHCSIVVHGAISSGFCKMCGNPYFSEITNKDELQEKAQEYGIGMAEDESPENCAKAKIDVAIEGFIDGYMYCLDQHW